MGGHGEWQLASTGFLLGVIRADAEIVTRLDRLETTDLYALNGCLIQHGNYNLNKVAFINSLLNPHVPLC